MSDPISAQQVFEVGFWALEREAPAHPSSGMLTRYQMGAADPAEVASVLSAAAAYEESAVLLADVASHRVALENLADLDLRSIALEGGLRAQVAQEILDLRRSGRDALERARGALGTSIAALLQALASGAVSWREAAAVRALRLPPQAAVYRDGGALTATWQGEELHVPLPEDAKGNIELRTEGDLVLDTISTRGGPVAIQVPGGRDALAIIVDQVDEPLLRYRRL